MKSQHQDVVPFWGPVTSTIDWCEPNYLATRFVAEPFNTLSNLSFILLGIAGAVHELRDRNLQISYLTLFASLAFIGISSLFFHASLTIWAQQADELSMVWHLLLYFHLINTKDQINVNPIWGMMLIGYCILFSIVHMTFKTTTLFQIHFGVLLALLLARIYKDYHQVYFTRAGKFVLLEAVVAALLGFGLWIFDYHYCELSLTYLYPLNGHVFWHIFMGIAAYDLIVTLKILESARLGQPLDVSFKMLIPFASVIKESTPLPSFASLSDSDDLKLPWKPLF